MIFGSGDMPDIICELAKSNFDPVMYGVAGVIGGFGFSMFLSFLGKSIYTIFYSIERSSY